MAKGLLGMIQERWSVIKETLYNDGLDHTPRRQQKHKKYKKKECNLVNPEVMGKGEPESAIRIFG